MAARKGFGSNWWAKRWLEVLESFGWSSRLQRGRAYARGGNVLSIDITPGLVSARVQGSRPKPYSVKINIKPLSTQDWNRVIDAMAGQAVYAARLLAGEMPQNIEEAFAGVSLSLFPQKSGDLTTECSCPDWANPCKHIAAVYYLLGEEFDSDPFLIFRLRGRTREEIITALRERRAGREDVSTGGTPVQEKQPEAENDAGDRPLRVEVLERFWETGDGLEGFYVTMQPPAVSLGVLKRLGVPPFWRAQRDFQQVIGECYRFVSRRAMELAFQTGEGSVSPGKANKQL